MTKFHWGTLLGVAAVAACSTDKPAEDPYDYTSQVQIREPGTAPANSPSPVATPTHSDHPADNSGDEVASDPSLLGADARRAESATPTPGAPNSESAAANTDSDNTNSNGASATPVNASSKESSKWTASDQGQSAADLKITQQLRKAVSSDSSLSFIAKNVQIITRDGKVVLRGQVKTSQERSSIDAMARGVAGVSQVDNLIEIKQ